MSKKDRRSSKMFVNIESIINTQNKPTTDFMKKQTKHLKVLNKLIKMKQNGEPIDASDIIKKLQSAGILDKKGELSKPYRVDDE